MITYYTDHITGESKKSDKNFSLDELLKLLRNIKTVGNRLIIQFPSGMGLDFQLQEDLTFWVEFYAETLSSAFVSKTEAEEVLKRAFSGINTNIKEHYSDLIKKWEY